MPSQLRFAIGVVEHNAVLLEGITLLLCSEPFDAIRRIRAADSNARVIALTTYELDSSGPHAMVVGGTVIIANSGIAETLPLWAGRGRLDSVNGLNKLGWRTHP